MWRYCGKTEKGKWKNGNEKRKKKIKNRRIRDGKMQIYPITALIGEI